MIHADAEREILIGRDLNRPFNPELSRNLINGCANLRQDYVYAQVSMHRIPGKMC
jgi:hypothetical protein